MFPSNHFRSFTKRKECARRLGKISVHKQCHALGMQQKKTNLHVRQNCDNNANTSYIYCPCVLTACLTGNHIHHRSWNSSGVTQDLLWNSSRQLCLHMRLNNGKGWFSSLWTFHPNISLVKKRFLSHINLKNIWKLRDTKYPGKKEWIKCKAWYIPFCPPRSAGARAWPAQSIDSHGAARLFLSSHRSCCQSNWGKGQSIALENSNECQQLLCALLSTLLHKKQDILEYFTHVWIKKPHKGVSPKLNALQPFGETIFFHCVMPFSIS